MTDEEVDQDKIQKKPVPVVMLTVMEDSDDGAHAHERGKVI